MLVLTLLTANVSGQVDEAAAGEAVSRARQVLTSSYEAVLEAEAAGADVSAFLSRLNAASDYLVRAEKLYIDGDFSGALGMATLVTDALAGLDVDATDLAGSVASELGRALFLAVAGSAFGVVLVVFAGFLGWGFVRGRYVKRVLKMKPEVSDVAES